MLGALAAAALLPGCGKPEPLRIGFLGSLSGRVADLGIGGRNGAQLAVDDLNAAGGIAGRQVELRVRDDEQNADVARRRLLELAAAGVRLVIGPMTSSVAIAVAPLAQERGLVLVSPTVTTHELSGKADAFFRVVSDAPRGAAQQAQFLFDQGLRSIATLADDQNRAFARSWVESAQRRFVALGGRVLLDLHFESRPGVQYAELAAALADAHADVVLLAASAADSALLMQQIRRRDARVALATSPWAGTEQLLQMGGRAVEGAIVPQYYDRDSQAAAYQQFVVRFRQRFGEAPGFPAVTGYDALMLGAEALRRRQGEAPLIEAMRTVRRHAGLQGELVLDEHGDSASPLYLTRVRDGQFESIARR